MRAFPRTLLLLAAPLSLAAQADDTRALDRFLQSTQLASASKRAQGSQDAPADVVVLTHQDLMALGYRTLGEALSGVAGFRTNDDRAYQNLGSRGLYILGDQNTRLLVLLDGHTLNAPGDNGSSKFGEDFGVPMELVDRIEIIRGPASSLYGNNAFFGVVNVVTRGVREGVSVEAAGTGGSRGLSDLWGRVGFGAARWQGSLALTGFQRTGTAVTYPDLQPQPIPAELDREERQSAYLRLRGAQWSFSGFAMSRTQHLDMGPFQSAVGDPRALYRNRVLFGDLRVEPTFGSVQTLFRAYGDRNWFYDAYAYDGVRTSDVGLFIDDNPERSLGLEAQARIPLGSKLFITVGHEQRRHRYSGLSGGLPSYAHLHLGYDLVNTYAQVEWFPTPSLSLTAGFQRGQWLVREVASDVDGVDSGLTSGGDRTHDTPRFSLIWKPTEDDTLKLLYAQGFREATVFERFYTDQVSFIPNSDLRAERMVTAEALWLRTWGGGFSSQVSASSFGWNDLIQAQDLGGNLQQFQNSPSQIKGAAYEAELRWQRGAWDLYASAGAYQWRQDGVDLTNVAKVQASLRAIYRTGAWSLAAEGRHVGDRKDAPYDAPAATTFRASLRYDQDGWWAQLTGEDLTDARRTELVATDYDPVRTMRGDGRALRATLGFRF